MDNSVKDLMGLFFQAVFIEVIIWIGILVMIGLIIGIIFKYSSMNKKIVYNENPQHTQLFYFGQYLMPRPNTLYFEQPQLIQELPEAGALRNPELMTLGYSDVQELIRVYLESIQNLDDYEVMYFIYHHIYQIKSGKYFKPTPSKKHDLCAGVVVLTRKDSGIRLYEL